jgi:hypothetical protein
MKTYSRKDEDFGLSADIGWFGGENFTLINITILNFVSNEFIQIIRIQFLKFIFEIDFRK